MMRENRPLLFWCGDRITKQLRMQHASTIVNVSPFDRSETVRVIHIISRVKEGQLNLRRVSAGSVEITEILVLLEVP